MFGGQIYPFTLPKNAVILCPYWNYIDKQSGVRRSRRCCNGSKYTAPQLHPMSSIWSSCVEFLIQRSFLILSAQKELSLFGDDACDKYINTPAPKTMTHLTIDDAYFEWYKKDRNAA